MQQSIWLSNCLLWVHIMAVIPETHITLSIRYISYVWFVSFCNHRLGFEPVISFVLQICEEAIQWWSSINLISHKNEPKIHNTKGKHYNNRRISTKTLFFWGSNGTMEANRIIYYIYIFGIKRRERRDLFHMSWHQYLVAAILGVLWCST